MSVLKSSPVKKYTVESNSSPNKLYLGLITLLRCHSNCPRISTLLVGGVGVEPTHPKERIYSAPRLSDFAARPKLWFSDQDLNLEYNCIRVV